MCVRVLVASIVQNVECIIDGASKREQKPTGSEWVLSSGDRCPVGNLESPNCVLSETATAGAIILLLLNLSLSLCICVCIYVRIHVCPCLCVCVSFYCLESPRSLRELWKINTLRQLCLFIHLITHYHCITVPLISHHRAQIDTFVLFYHTGVWCNQLNLHLTPDTCIKWTLSMNMGASTTQQYEKEESKSIAQVWERNLRVWGSLDCLIGELCSNPGRGCQTGATLSSNRSHVRCRFCPTERLIDLPCIYGSKEISVSSVCKVKYAGSFWRVGGEVTCMRWQNIWVWGMRRVCFLHMSVSLCAHKYSDRDSGGGGCLPVWDSEQRAGGLGMEQRICIDCFCASELFSRCQSCLYQLRGKLQHLHQEAFSFSFLNLFIYLFLQWERYLQSPVSEDLL